MMRSPLTSISSYQEPLPDVPGGNASIWSIDRMPRLASDTLNKRPRRRMTRTLPATLTMPPSSTSASCVLVIAPDATLPVEAAGSPAAGGGGGGGGGGG